MGSVFIFFFFCTGSTGVEGALVHSLGMLLYPPILALTRSYDIQNTTSYLDFFLVECFARFCQPPPMLTHEHAAGSCQWFSPINGFLHLRVVTSNKVNWYRCFNLHLFANSNVRIQAWPRRDRS
jgi:hypothetical protein